jgi:hypothetical protein
VKEKKEEEEKEEVGMNIRNNQQLKNNISNITHTV